MPFLNKDNTDGFVHCLFRRNSTPQDAHSYLTEYLGQETVTIEEVTALFKKFKDGTFKSEYPEKILLVEKLKFTKHSVMEFCDLFQGNFNIRNFEAASGMRDFLEEVYFELKNRKKSEEASKWNYYSRDFLHGFIRCLKSQGKKQEEIHGELKELTIREVFTLEDVAEVFNVDDDVLLKLGYDFSELPRRLIEDALNYSSIDSRVNIRRTCSLFNEIENTIDYGISCVHLKFYGERFQVKSGGKVESKQYDSVLIGSSNYQLYFVHENDNVWMDTGSDGHQFRKMWNVMAHTPRCTVRNFKIGFCRMPQDPKKLLKLIGQQDPVHAQNLYFYGGQEKYFKAFVRKFEPTVLRKIAIYCEFSFGLDRRFFTLPQFSGAKEFITNRKCNVVSLEYFGGLKFGRFNTYILGTPEIMRLKNTLLAQETNFREIKLEVHLFDHDFNAINIELETFNQRDTENPRFAEFPYPPPNENKVLKLAVFKTFCWFQGPEWRHGEMEGVERELEFNSDSDAIRRQQYDFPKKQYTRAKGFEGEEEHSDISEVYEDKESDDDTSRLNQDVADGLLFGMFRQQSTATDAHATIVQYFGAEFMNIMQVKVLFRRFKEENYEHFCPERLLLVENQKIKKLGVLGFCEFYDSYDLKRMPGMKNFHAAVNYQLEKSDQWSFYNRDFLRGFINSLKNHEKTPEEIYASIMELTKQEVLGMEDINEDINMENDKLVAKRSFKQDDLGEITSLHCNLHGKRFRFIIEPHMIELNHNIVALERGLEDLKKRYIRLIYENGNVWLSKTRMKPKDDCSAFIRAWKSLQQSKSTIENFMMSISMVDTSKILKIFREHGHLPVKNAYFHCACDSVADDYFDSVCVLGLAPGVLKRIAIYCDGWMGQDEHEFFLTDQFMKAEEFIANGRCRVPEDTSFAHLKFGRFKVGWIREADIMAWKDELLTRPTDFREMKFEVDIIVTGDDPNGLSTFDNDFSPVDPESLLFDSFPYPEPNQDKFLELAVVDKHFFWFRGPGRIHGEMEQVEMEMELNKPDKDDDRKNEDLAMHRGCFEKKVYTLEEAFGSDIESDYESDNSNF